MPYPLGEAGAHSQRARIPAQQGTLEQAAPRLDKALANFQRLSARPDIERTEQAFVRSIVI